jgi:hypothetical protein
VTRAAAVVALLVALAACAPKALKLPQGAGEPLADYVQAFDAASAPCRDVRTLTAEASVSGTVGAGKIRGRLIAGFERGGRMRLEGVAPIGPPAFILASDAGTATLVLPRSREVLAGQPAERVLDALVGVSLRSDDLEAILAGCVSADPRPTSGRRYPDGWAAVELEGGDTAYLRRDGEQWRVRAAFRPLVAIEYEPGDPGARVPRAVRLRAAGDGGPGASLRITLSQVEINGPIAAKAFAVVVPAGSVPITLADLKQSGPLGSK